MDVSSALLEPHWYQRVRVPAPSRAPFAPAALASLTELAAGGVNYIRTTISVWHFSGR